MASDDLRQRLKQYGQEHLLDIVDRLDDAKRAELARELEQIDLAELITLFEQRNRKDALPERRRIHRLPNPSLTTDDLAAFRARGEEAFRRGEIAFLVVAGGEGTRLGFDHAKGMFPIGPVSKKSLFQIHVEKVLALRRRHGAALPLLVMTSPATDAETRRYFAQHQNFGLPENDVWTFCQGTMPALDLSTGRLLLEAPERLCLSPNGHGGTIAALIDSGLLDRLEQRGVRTISYFQVDNPLTNLGDFVFVGRHHAEDAQVSSKVLPKASPMERVGNFALIDGRCAMIEYSDLPDAWAHEKDAAGNLLFWAGSPAIHLFDVAFLREIARRTECLPWHLARKKVAHLAEADPQIPNALKFERFIFDILPHADRWTVLPTTREDEFAPVKNKDSDRVDCPATSRQLMTNCAAKWLREAGTRVPFDGDGNSIYQVEISPLLAMDAEEVRARIKGIARIDRDTYLG
ncbi:MAG: UTP--glucose-1-phosphate uridylyltransferase [Planctomycetes bacterium]|nr:UTP--glucose-1-phosphate uridylyltransferase [Planctomycetota bacterium]